MEDRRKLLVTEMGRLDVEGFKAARKLPLCVVLDDIRSAHNVGSVFRTADAFRLEGLCLCGITACPPSTDIHKTALGAEHAVAWQHYDSALSATLALKARGYTVMALEQAVGSTPLQQLRLDPHGRYALVIGNEVKGVDQRVVSRADVVVEIPQFGTKHSLNVSVSCGVALWQMVQGLLPAL